MPPKKRVPAKERKKEQKKEEKMSAWQLKILEKLEKRRLREEELKRELAATQKNYKIVDNTWRKILRKVQTPLIKEDALAMRMRFDHLVDIKNQVIILLRDALDEEEEQTLRCGICHSEAIKQLLEMYVDRLKDLRRENQVLEEKLVTSVTRTIQEEIRRNSEDVEQQQVTAYISELHRNENELQHEAEIHAKLDDDANRLAAQIQEVRALLGIKLKMIWDEILTVIAEYQKRTAELHKAYLIRKERDSKAAADIQRYSERTKSLHLLVKHMQDKERRTKEKMASLNGLKEERKDFIYVHARLREYLRQDRKGDAARLTDLVRQSNESLKWLSEMEKKGERILSLAKLCQFMQTEFETVVANGQRHFTEEMTDNFSEPGQEVYLTQPSVEEEAVEVCKKLAIFWRRVGRAQLTRNILAEECKSLKAQNEMLRNKLCEYLTRVRTYSTSKPASNQHTKKKGFTVIEASHVYKHLI